MRGRTVSRRNLIKGGIAAGAAIAIPSVVPSTVLGADAPSERVHVGQIGCGGISNYHTHYLSRMKDVRVIAVADVYDALATSRPYRLDAYPHETVRQMIAAERGGAFDPDIVDAFMQCEAKLAAISQGQLDEVAPAEPVQGETGPTTSGAARPWHGGVLVEAARDIPIIS